MTKTKKKNRIKKSIEYVNNHPIILIIGLFLLIVGFFEEISKYASFVIEFLYEIFSYSITFNIVIIFTLIIAFFLIFRKISGKKKYVMAVLIILAVVFIGMQTYNLHEISDKTVIVIAEFDDKKATTKADVSKRIYDSLKTEKDKLNLELLKIEKIPTVIQSDEEAQREGNKGARKNAKTVIVIWGQYDDIDINTFFTVVKAPNKETIENVKLEKSKGLTIAELENFDLTYIREILPDTMVSLTDFIIGMGYYWEGDYDNAIFQFNASLEKLPEDEELKEEMKELLKKLYFYMGTSYYFQGHLISAEREYRKVMGLNPEYDAGAHNNLGVSLYYLGRYAEAEEEYKEAIRINHNYTDAHYNLGNLLYDSGRYAEAEEEYKIAINIVPEYADAHTNLGLSLYYLKRYEESEEEYREAIEINPELAEAHGNLGILLEELKRYDEAEEELKIAHKLFLKQGKTGEVNCINLILNELKTKQL